MKEDMKNVRALIDLIGANADKFAAAQDKAKNMYDALEKAQDAHSKINTDNAKKVYKDNAYTRFYNDLHEFLLNSRKIIRDGSEKGSVTESDLSTLDRSYDSLVGSYNSFNS